MRVFLLGLFTGVFLCLIGISFAAERRSQWLQHYRLELKELPVPREVLFQIRCAEATYYESRPAWRRAAENVQDAVAIAVPALAYRFDWSVGSYRIKAKTVEKLLRWAEDQGYLWMSEETRDARHSAISYFAEMPVLSRWEASLYLEWLRQEHPQLRNLSWKQIAASDEKVAKIYSGYMGAGGDMDLWRKTDEPGAVAVGRLAEARDACSEDATP